MRPSAERVRELRESARLALCRVGEVKSLGADEQEIAAAEQAAGRAHVVAELAALAHAGDPEAGRLLERHGPDR